MKEIRNFIIFEFIVILIKAIGGFVTNSYTMIASSIYDLTLIIIMIMMTTKKENTACRGILSSLIGFIFVILGIAITFLSVTNNHQKMSLWVILFVFISVIFRYLVNCIYTNNSYQRKKGLLSISLINSNVDFYNYGIILGTLIIFKIGHWFPILRYADIVGTILIAILPIFKGLKIIKNSFHYLEDDEQIIEDKVKEIEARSEVKKVNKIAYTYYGGIRKSTCELILNDNINMIDLNSFVVTLQDFLLKEAEVVRIDLIEAHKTIKKKPKVRSLKQDARNSRSGNSKTNTKKKNTKKKNKKR